MSKKRQGDNKMQIARVKKNIVSAARKHAGKDGMGNFSSFLELCKHTQELERLEKEGENNQGI